jgi:hypothetical protein
VAAIGLTRCPSLIQIGAIRVEFAFETRIWRPFRKAIGLQIPAYSRSGDVQALCYLLLQRSGLIECEHLLLAGKALRTPLLLLSFAIWVAHPSELRQWQGCVRRMGIVRCGSAGLHLVRLLGKRLSSRLAYVDHLVQDLLDRGAQVLHEMEAVSNLDRVGRTLCGAFGKRASTITRDNRHTRMGLQPGREGRGTGIGKQLKWPPGTEVNQDGFEIQAFAIGPLVHAEERGRHRFSQSCAADQAQDGGWTHGHALALSDASGHCSADLEPEMALFGRHTD